MEHNFWLEKWQSGQIGFHQNRVLPLLQKFWVQTGLDKPAKILVPLAGKTLDIAWFSELGHEIWAIELSEIAVRQFFTEHGLDPEINKTDTCTIYKSGNINYICGDIFSLKADFFHDFQGCYDRAALVALPDEMRQKYVQHVYGNLPLNSKVLLLTIDYDQAEMQGPPFAVSTATVNSLFANSFDIQTLDSRDILAGEPKFKERGLSSMLTKVYLLNKKQA